MLLTLSFEATEFLHPIDVPEDLTLGDLKTLLLEEFPQDFTTASLLIHNGKPLTDETCCLNDLGLADDEIVTVRKVVEQQDPSQSEEAMLARLTPDQIRQLRVDQNLHHAMEHMPESFTPTPMLYIPLTINGNKTMAFLDTGAQSTIITPRLAKLLGIDHLLDTRFKGVAMGVGQGEILGRIHSVECVFGGSSLYIGFSVMEMATVDLLFGLDMLRRWQGVIDLKNLVITLGGGSPVKFVSEVEVQAWKTDIDKQTGKHTKTTEPTKEDKPTPVQVPAPQPGAVPTIASRTSMPATSVPVPSASATTSVPTTTAAPSFPESDISKLVNLGFSRPEAINALKQCNGNVDYAASLMFM